MNKKVLAVFQNRTHALTFSRALNKLGVKTRIVNTPRELTLSCGLSVQFDYKDLNMIIKTNITQGLGSLSGFYVLNNTNSLPRYVKV